MRSLLIRSLVLLSMALGLASLPAAQREDHWPAHRAAQRDIVALSDNLNDPDVAIMARNIVSDHDSEDISSVFAMREQRGGLGIGSLVKAGHRDSIERLILDYARKAPSKEELDTYQTDLDRTARVLQAMSELAPHRNPYIGKDTRQNLEWQRVAADVKFKTAEFREAIKCKEPERVRKAAQNLNHTCCDCHSLL